jgi:hypothetical protein
MAPSGVYIYTHVTHIRGGLTCMALARWAGRSVTIFK